MDYPNETEMLSPAEVQRRFSIPVGTLSFWRFAGIGPKFYRVSERRILYSLNDLRSFLEGKKVDPVKGGAL